MSLSTNRLISDKAPTDRFTLQLERSCKGREALGLSTNRLIYDKAPTDRFTPQLERS